MAKKTTVDQEVDGEAERDAEGAQDSKRKGGGVDEALDKGKPSRKAEPSASPFDKIGELRDYTQEVLAELKKVQWPGRKQVRAEVITVISTVALMTAYIYGLDHIFSMVSNLMFKQ